MEYPAAGLLQTWLNHHRSRAMSEIPSICTDNLGFYLFLKYCASNGSTPCVLFVEAVAKFKVGSVGRSADEAGGREGGQLKFVGRRSRSSAFFCLLSACRRVRPSVILWSIDRWLGEFGL